MNIETAQVQFHRTKSTDFDLIDSAELSRRLNLPESWVRDQVRSRATDPIPHLRFGRYVRFQWAHPDLMQWLERKRK
jgi:hypothetical protein